MTVQRLFAKEALLPDGWQRDVLIEIEGDLITRVTPNAVANGAEVATGAVIPIGALFGWLDGRDAQVSGWKAELGQLAQGRLQARRETPLPRADLRVIFERA